MMRLSAVTLVLAVFLGGSAMSPAIADSIVLAHIGVNDVRFTATGAVKVTASYVCPTGFAVHEDFAGQISVRQFVDEGQLVRFKRYPKIDFTCDGSRNDITVGFRTARSGEAFRPDVPLTVFAYLSPDRATIADYVEASDIETETPETVLADIEIQTVELTRTGNARVTAIYRCPDGFVAEDTLAWLKRLDDPAFEIKHFTQRLECDGSRKELVARFQTTSQGDPIETDVPYAVRLEFGPIGDGFTAARDIETIVIQA